jgi:hypothetical protein
MGTGMLRVPHGVIRRCTAAGRFREGDASLRAWQLWCQLRGLAQLVRAGYFTGPRTPEETLQALVTDFAIGADTPRKPPRPQFASATASASASASVRASASASVRNLP